MYQNAKHVHQAPFFLPSGFIGLQAFRGHLTTSNNPIELIVHFANKQA